MKCQVCGGEDDVVVCGCHLAQPISVAYCQRCLQEGIEEYDLIVSLVSFLGRTGVADWAQDIIDRSLIFHGKTWEDLETDARSLNEV